MLEEQTIVDKIEIDELGRISVRRATVITRDGVRLPTALGYHRIAYEPGDDLTDEIARVQAIASAIWTDDVIDATKARQAARLAEVLQPLQDEPSEKE